VLGGSAGRIGALLDELEVSSVDVIPPRLSTLMHHVWDEQQAVAGRSLEPVSPHQREQQQQQPGIKPESQTRDVSIYLFIHRVLNEAPTHPDCTASNQRTVS
jgi:hypothetical protein